jgi:hypothetical protein
MSSEEVKRYRVLCIAENKMVTAYGIKPPTLCPNDHADRSIDHSRTVLAATFKRDQVEIFDPTTGNFQYTTLKFSVPSGSAGDVSDHDFSWPMTLDIWKTEFMAGTEHVGDSMNVMIDPDRVIGILTADANIGDTELSVSSAGFAHPALSPGLEIKLDDTSNSEDLGRITGVDSVNFKLHVENGLTQNFLAGTQVIINVCIVKDAMVSQTKKAYIMGSKGIKSKELPSDIVMRFRYKNNDGVAKDVHIEMEYNYH